MKKILFVIFVFLLSVSSVSAIGNQIGIGDKIIAGDYIITLEAISNDRVRVSVNGYEDVIQMYRQKLIGGVSIYVNSIIAVDQIQNGRSTAELVIAIPNFNGEAQFVQFAQPQARVAQQSEQARSKGETNDSQLKQQIQSLNKTEQQPTLNQILNTSTKIETKEINITEIKEIPQKPKSIFDVLKSIFGKFKLFDGLFTH